VNLTGQKLLVKQFTDKRQEKTFT